MPKPYESQLSKLGFSDKEARVYLASLELGPAPIQKIAEKSGVKRVTTYVMVEALMDRGLMASYEKGKKTLFTAESPERLMSILESEKKSVLAKQNLLQDLLPDLLAFGSASERPKVTFFEGVDGLKAIHDDILKTKDKALENIVALDDVMKVEPSEEDVAAFREALDKKGIAVRILYTSKDKALSLPSNLKNPWSVKRASFEKYPLHGEITLYGDKVAAFSYRGQIFGTIIESKEIAQAVRVLFELSWASIN